MSQELTTPPQPDLPPRPNLLEGEKGFSSLLGQFFIVPLIIAVTAVAIFVGIKMMTSDEKDAVRLVKEIQMEHGSSRWQIAYDLNSRLIRDPQARKDPRLVPEIIKAFQSIEPRTEDDRLTRMYLVTVLGTLADPGSLPLILNAMQDQDGRVQVAAIQSAGALGDPAVVAELLAFAAADDAGLRKAAVFALGCFAPRRRAASQLAELPSAQTAEIHEAIRKCHADRVTDVRWNAALALSRFDDAEAAPTLLQMLDREHLEKVAKEPGTEMTEEMVSEVMVNAMKGAMQLKGAEFKSVLEKIRKQDRSMDVRQAAGEVLQALSN
ncbi:MAG: HEAT repeat domain-containing protein [Candidatus Brocadiae bacterium]|nr:HEAT repeat domain-containing protein [Candidatus Brocadiia bacterium]